MQETIDNIVEKARFQDKELFGELIKKCVQVSNDSAKSTYAIHDNVIFKVEVLFKNFAKFIDEFGKDNKYEAGVEVLSVICEELGIEIDKEECFILFHIRDLGKFRMKESKLLDELKPLWKKYKDYALDDQDFSYALKSLMRKDFIQYRRGNLHIKPSVIIRYRSER